MKLKNIRIIKIFLGVFLLFFLLTEFLIIREYLNDYNERNQRKKMDYVIVLGGKLYGGSFKFVEKSYNGGSEILT